MKKLISFLLVIMLLSSISVSAFATDDSRLGVSFENDEFKTDDVSTGDVETELWLQVDAKGQIDVTVPLVLVFRTNIDGGKADTASNYAISNNNGANIVVTDVVVDPDETRMELVGENALTAEDQYWVTFDVTADIAPAEAEGGKTDFDLDDLTFNNPAKKGGLFSLNRSDAQTGAATPTTITATMETSDLSFVTTRTADDKNMDKDYGVQLLTVTYTVAINTKDAYGSLINDDTNPIDMDKVVWNPALPVTP